MLNIQNNEYKKMKYKINKSEIPIIFFDTSIFIYLSKKENYDTYRKIENRVINKEIIIVSCGQEEEFLRNNIEKDQEILQIFLSLTCGHFMDMNLIERIQYDQYAKENLKEGYEKFDKRIKRLLNTKFTIDFKEVLIKNNYEMMIKVLMNLILKDAAFDKKRINKSLCKIAKYKKSFEKYMVDELLAECHYIEKNMKILEKVNCSCEKDIEKNINDKFLKEILLQFLTHIRKYGDSDKSLNTYQKYMEELILFHNMHFVYIMPYKYIISKLYAYLFFNSKIASGDFKDIEYAAHLLPYCNYYFTDKTMCNIIKELKLDEKFSTKIFRIKDINVLLTI